MSPGIPPYGERDQELAAAAIAQVVQREGEPAGLLREVAGAIATARAEGLAAAFLHIAERIDETLPALGIRAGRELRELAAELRIEARS